MNRSEFLQLILAAIASLFVGFRPKHRVNDWRHEDFTDGRWEYEFARDVYWAPDGTRWTLEELDAMLAEFHAKQILRVRP